MKKILNFKNSIIGKIGILFIIMFVFLLTPVVIQTYTTFNQAQLYTEMINNITYANQLNNDVNTEIEPVVWGIVAGKTTFEDSGITPLVEDIEKRMHEIKANTLSVEGSGIMDISLRALATMEGYLDKLKNQIDTKSPVAEREETLEEIRVCASGIDDLLKEFSSKQLIEIDKLNQEWSRQSNNNFIINILLIATVVVAGVLVLWYISREVMKPAEKLLQMSNKISEGDFSSRIDGLGSQEFNELGISMNTMSEKIELLIETSVEKEKQVRMLEYKAHQAQITPHFLYNTLDAIIWAAEAQDMSKVITLVSALSSFFRISLSQGIDFIPISEEIAHVQNYLRIQKIRYSDVLSYAINVDDSIGNQKILKLLLQPLVENSLYHGIKGSRRRGKITVNAVVEDGKVKFSVIDNGVGMTEEKLEQLKKALASENESETGYGLHSVNRRLKLYYGLKDGLEIRSEYKKMTEVSFVLDIL